MVNRDAPLPVFPNDRFDTFYVRKVFSSEMSAQVLIIGNFKTLEMSLMIR